MSESRTLSEAQYRSFLSAEGAQPHRQSTAAHLIFYLPRRNAWLTARGGRRGTVVVRLYPRCPCET